MKYVSFVLLLALYSCSTEEVQEEPLDVSLLFGGRWEGYHEYVQFEDGKIESWTSDFCQGNIFRFYEDGRIWWVDFVPGDAPDHCAENQATDPIGTWEILNGNKIIITLQPANTDLAAPLVIGPFEIEFQEVAGHYVFDELPPGAPEGVVKYYRVYFKDSRDL